MLFTRFSMIAISCLVCFGSIHLLSGNANAQALTATFSAQVEEDEIDPRDDGVDSDFFNVQGDDDAFTVYSLVDFDTSSIGQVSAVTGISLDLTQSNAFFSADGGILFFLAADTRPVGIDDTARYISDFANGGSTPNIGADVVGDAFGTLYPLGTGTYTLPPDEDPDAPDFVPVVESSVLSLDAEGEAFAIAQINSGGLLRIIATPADAVVQATYAGSAPREGFAAPVLNVTVTPSTGGPLLGDVNLDEAVNFLDISPFIGLLSAGGSSQAEADITGDGVVDFSDISPFIGLLSGGSGG